MERNEGQRTRAIALLAGNGAATAFTVQFVLDHYDSLTATLALGAFGFLCTTATGLAISYFALRAVGKSSFNTLEGLAAILFGSHIISLAIALYKVLDTGP